MKVFYNTQEIALTDALKSFTEKKLDVFEKYVDESSSLTVSFSVVRQVQKAEVLIYNRGVFIKGTAESNDMYISIDKAINKALKQILKFKDKKASKGLYDRKTEESFLLSIYDNVDSDDYVNGKHPQKIVEKEIPNHPMSLEESILQMDLLEKDFFVFKDSETFETKVVYKRTDGKIGVFVS